MATYHVGFNKETGRILAGTKTKTGKWQNTSDVTEEVLAAARDNLLYLTAKEKTDIYYGWKYNNGKTIIMKLEEKDSEEIKEE